MWRKLRAVGAPLTIVAINSSGGFTERTFAAVRSLVDAARPDFAEYLAPQLFIVCFKPKSAARGSALIANVRELRSRDGLFSDIGAGSAEGMVFYQHDWLRRIRSGPMGDVVNAALRAATVDAGGATSGRNGAPMDFGEIQQRDD